MGDDADELSVPPEAGQRLQSRFECLFVKGSKSFIEKKGINTHVPAGHLRKGQGQADEEAFAAGEVFRGADLPGLVVVDHIQFQRLPDVSDEKIAVRHLAELPVGVRDHHLESQPLGEIAEFLAVRRADQLMQRIPAQTFLFLGVELPEAFLLSFPQVIVILQSFDYAADFESDLFELPLAGTDVFFMFNSGGRLDLFSSCSAALGSGTLPWA